ncbi:hypothetical protein GIB67_030056 [Kingdonia uniflora]|uniref:non-specific serine/threonine protein kinase n=1 Tax=Kingdonia uniflora TaxID=39325 RepID=A0A7J7MYN7_9MAGN|nr:hypothetical protein GIB67_030056 [Kingdonia uniflora]
MGNCWPSAARVDNKSFSTNRTSTPGTSKNISSGGEFSGSSVGGDSLLSGTSGIRDFSFPNGQILPTPNLRIYSFSELKSATKNFKNDTVLGEGGFGKVYKGVIDDKNNGGGQVVAVKKLNPESMQGVEEWQSEVDFLGRLSHPNLVKLLGYCLEDQELLLVYEYMQKGSLENHIFRKGSFQPLTWGARLRIILGAARGLAFLHSAEKEIIYRDFKASNILLDGNYIPKLSDFGLARHGPEGSASHVTTRVIGTYGYAAPEYVSTGHLYVKSDVYGFGVVLLEMMTGLRALDPNRPTGQHNLVDWLKPSLTDRRKLKRIMDPRLEGQYSVKGAIQAAELTLKCLGTEPRMRPPMKEVVESLEQIEALKGRTTKESTTSMHTRHVHHHTHHRSPLHPKYGSTSTNTVAQTLK